MNEGRGADPVLVRGRGRAGGARRGFRMGTPVRDPSARSRESAGGARLVAAFPGRRRTAGSGWRSFGEYLSIKDSCYKIKGQGQLSFVQDALGNQDRAGDGPDSGMAR
jgi:hypothetical protein